MGRETSVNNDAVAPANLTAPDGRPLKIAIVHDWLTNMGGSEKVVLTMHELFPDAPIYTSAYLPDKLPEYSGCEVHTTFIQHVPFFKNHHKFAPILRMLAFPRLDLSDYDIVISDTTAEAKGVKTKKKAGSGALHICNCNTPTRYYWSNFEEYVKNPSFGILNPLVRFGLKLLIKPLRAWDLQLAKAPDVYIGNSTEVVARIKQYYHRDATMLFPSVATDAFPLQTGPRNGYVIAGRQVPYKRFDLAIQACNQLKLPLTVIGRGPEHEALQKMAGNTITFKQADDRELAEAYGQAKALLYPGKEDAGIVPVEAMAAGTPVIAFGEGGVLDSISNKVTGILFAEQSVDSLVQAIERFETIQFDPQIIHDHAEQFSKAHFQAKLLEIVKREYTAYIARSKTGA